MFFIFTLPPEPLYIEGHYYITLILLPFSLSDLKNIIAKEIGQRGNTAACLSSTSDFFSCQSFPRSISPDSIQLDREILFLDHYIGWGNRNQYIFDLNLETLQSRGSNGPQIRVIFYRRSSIFLVCNDKEIIRGKISLAATS